MRTIMRAFVGVLVIVGLVNATSALSQPPERLHPQAGMAYPGGALGLSPFDPEQFGIGATLVERDSVTIEVLECSRGGPAERAGIWPGDRLIALDTLSVIGMHLDAVLSRLRSNKPLPVRLTLARGQSELAVTVQRMRFSDIAAGEDLKYVPNPDSTGYTAVPLHERDPWRIGDVPDMASVGTPACDDARLSFAGGTPTFVYFWASWCGPCKHFMKELRRHLEFNPKLRGVRIIGIDTDEDCGTFATWLARVNPPGEQYWSGGWRGEIAQRFRSYSRGIPCGAFVASDGKIVGFAVGADSLTAMLLRNAGDRF